MSGEQLAQEMRAVKEQEALYTRKTTLLFLDMLCIAHKAVYTAGVGGNVTCKAAILELEKLWKSHYLKYEN